MPFVTEEIWQKLPLKRMAKALVVASYPSVDTRLMDTKAEADLAPVISAIESVRNIRGESNLDPKLKLLAEIQVADVRLRQLLEQGRDYLLPLAGLSDVQVLPPGPKPKLAAAYVGDGLEVYVPLAGLINLDEERARVSKELVRLKGEGESLQKKLSNEGFLTRAPPDVVEKDRERLAELVVRKAKLEEHLKRIAPEQAMDPETPPSNPPQNPAGNRRAADPRPAGSVDLGAELKSDLEAARIPSVPDENTEEGLRKLRLQTQEGLSSEDHYDLGVAYMGMGLVDDAVREFNQAKKGGPTKKKAKASAKGTRKAKATRKSKPARKAAGKKAAPKKSTKKKTSARKTAARKSRPKARKRR
jgi:valyl-tRNA synthetase